MGEGGTVSWDGGAPLSCQSMTNTDTADIETTLKQTLELARPDRSCALDREVPEAAAAVPEK